MPGEAIGLEAIFAAEEFIKGIGEYNSAIADATSRTESGSSAMSRAFDGLATVGGIAFGAVTAGLAAFTAGVGMAIGVAMEAEGIITRMEFVVGNLGERTGVTAEDVLKLADSMAQVVPIDDEVIAEAIAMGLTFDGVNKDNIQPLISAAADLAAFTGKDLPSTMRELAMAISDPDKAMRLLKDANITLTDAEMKTLKGFKDMGDTAGATTYLLEELKKKGITGLGEAMGQTAEGKMTIMKTAIENVQDALGGGLLDALKGVFDKITEFATDPRTISFFTDLGKQVGAFADMVLAKLPSIWTAIQGVVDWLANNKAVVVGVLGAIGVAMLAFGLQAAAAGVTAAIGLLPIIIPLVAIGAAIALLYTAWTENWGGIQGKVASAWAQVKPVFDQLQAWMAENLPKAIKSLSNFWTNTLLPAIKKAFDWIANNVLPLLVKLILWLGVNVPKAIKVLSDFWTNTLLPAIKTVVAWIIENVIPILVKLFEWLGTNIPKAIKILADFWNNVLLPAIKAVAAFFKDVLIPIFNAVVDFIQGVFTAALNALSALWNNVLLPAIMAVYNFINTYIMPIFNALANLVSAVLGAAIRILSDLWNNVLLPALRAVWDFIQNFIIPIFTTIASTVSGVLHDAIQGLIDLWEKYLLPAIIKVWDKISPFVDFLKNIFVKAWEAVKDAIQWVVDLINDLAGLIEGFTLPDWLLNLVGGGATINFSLTGLNDLNQQLKDIEGSMSLTRELPGARGIPSSGGVSNSSQSTKNYLYGAQFSVNSQSNMIEILQGLA